MARRFKGFKPPNEPTWEFHNTHSAKYRNECIAWREKGCEPIEQRRLQLKSRKLAAIYHWLCTGELLDGEWVAEDKDAPTPEPVEETVSRQLTLV